MLLHFTYGTTELYAFALASHTSRALSGQVPHSIGLLYLLDSFIQVQAGVSSMETVVAASYGRGGVAKGTYLSLF